MNLKVPENTTQFLWGPYKDLLAWTLSTGLASRPEFDTQYMQTLRMVKNHMLSLYTVTSLYCLHSYTLTVHLVPVESPSFLFSHL